MAEHLPQMKGWLDEGQATIKTTCVKYTILCTSLRARQRLPPTPRARATACLEHPSLAQQCQEGKEQKASKGPAHPGMMLQDGCANRKLRLAHRAQDGPFLDQFISLWTLRWIRNRSTR